MKPIVNRNTRKMLWQLKENWQIFLLLILLITGPLLQHYGLIDWRDLLDWSKAHSQNYYIAIILIIIQILLFVFALPGSSMLWVVASLYQPLIATLMLTLGTTFGALGAYWLAGKSQSPWLEKLKKKPLIETLKQHSDFYTLLVLRILPGFPHSAINYTCGLLRIPVLPFIAATCIGCSIKTYLYARIIFNLTAINEISDVFSKETILPLTILVILSILLKMISVWQARKN